MQSLKARAWYIFGRLDDISAIKLRPSDVVKILVDLENLTEKQLEQKLDEWYGIQWK